MPKTNSLHQHLIIAGTFIAMLFGSTIVKIPSSHADSVDFIAAADGDVLTFGGDSIDTVDTRLQFQQSGGLIRNVILEFDIGDLSPNAVINSASLNVVKDGNLANTGSNPAPVEIFGYVGDGNITLGDYDAPASSLGSGEIILGLSNGTALDFTLDTVLIQAIADSTGLLTLRLETNNFATVNFASTETTTAFAPPTLTLEISAVPEPSSAILIAGWLAGFCAIQRRK
ncbi:hypothetical protein [Mariniblastus fucicola]|uniref:PEP-CTERM protein-sorting domain-containing protein n=1 Tax=Mariniblastus fucicola TaxID=980251 RepID=A0A5B9PKU0_9BACT|nr:hypothetical protein [Mariniblastus fucicola]QEG23013.1 hypothetical protein MFFC18_29050 [Mariniblastus fucicola]